MKTNQIAIFLLTTLLVGCRTYDARLHGTWKSDADRSVARLAARHDLPEDKQDAWKQIFGQLVITFDKNSYTTELRGVTETIPYRVLGKDSHTTAIQFCSKHLDENNITIIRYEDDGCWILSLGGDTWEYFRKRK